MRLFCPAFLLACALLSPKAWASHPARSLLDEARWRIDELDYELALSALAQVQNTLNLERDEVLELWSLQGVAFGVLSKEAKARDAFRKLLLLEPTFPPPTSDLPPRVLKPFREAVTWASANGPMHTKGQAHSSDGLVKSVSLTVEKDLFRLSRLVRFHLKIDGKDTQVDIKLNGSRAQCPVEANSVAWWAEVLGENQAVLLSLADAANPREVRAPALAIPVETVSVAPTPPPSQAKPQPADAATSIAADDPPPSNLWRRPTGIGLLGLGAVAGGVGALLGYRSAAARSMIANAPLDAQGKVTGLTQREAEALEERAREQATMANVLFGVGGALAAGGLVLTILGPTSSPSLALSPAPGGASLSGAF